MEIQQRKSITDNLKKYCICSNGEHDFIEITQWANGEGIDVTIVSNGHEKSFSVTHGELEAIQYLRMTLDYQE